MKIKIAVIVGILTLLGVLARAEEPILATEGNYYRAGEFGVSLGADVASDDLENGRLGYLAALRYYHTLNWGVALETTATSFESDSVRLSPLLLFRLPYGKAALLMEAGPEYQFDSEDWSGRISVGPAYRFTKNIEASLTVGARKFFGHGQHDQSIESVTSLQVTVFFGK